MQHVDLNCDIGERFGVYQLGHDEQLMDIVSSVNIACGFHGGDPTVMRQTVELAVQKSVAIGAHPGYPDMQGFGRRDMNLSSEEVFDIVIYQIGALMAFVKAAGGVLHHVKPHGALYNRAARDSRLAGSVARAVHSLDRNLILVGLSGSCLVSESLALGLKTVNEAFCDRTYQDDGNLTSRKLADSLIEDPNIAAEQALQITRDKTVTSVTGIKIPVHADTLCIHGDGRFAVEHAAAIASLLKKNGIAIKTC